MESDKTNAPRSDALEAIFQTLADIDALGPGHTEAALQVAWEAHRTATAGTLFRGDSTLHISTLAHIVGTLTGSSAPTCLQAAQRAVAPDLPSVVLAALKAYLANHAAEVSP